MPRVVGYVRVSGAEQGRTGTSLEAQAAEIRAWCVARGLGEPAIAVEVESGSAERAERRVEQRRLVRELEAGDVLVCTRVDRWSRDIAHAVSTVRALVARGVRVHLIADAIDAATPSGDQMLGILAWAV